MEPEHTIPITCVPSNAGRYNCTFLDGGYQGELKTWSSTINATSDSVNLTMDSDPHLKSSSKVRIDCTNMPSPKYPDRPYLCTWHENKVSSRFRAARSPDNVIHGTVDAAGTMELVLTW